MAEAYDLVEECGRGVSATVRTAGTGKLLHPVVEAAASPPLQPRLLHDMPVCMQGQRLRPPAYRSLHSPGLAPPARPRCCCYVTATCHQPPAFVAPAALPALIVAWLQVYRAICRQYNEEVAVKLLDLENMNCSLDEIVREAQVGAGGGWVHAVACGAVTCWTRLCGRRSWVFICWGLMVGIRVWVWGWSGGPSSAGLIWCALPAAAAVAGAAALPATEACWRQR